MDPNFPSSLQRQSNYPPGFTNSKKIQIKPTTNPYFPSNQVFNKVDILEPNKNTQSTFMIEPIANPYKGSSEMIIEHLDLDNFKSAPCLINYTHNHKHCPFYHNAKDRKRPGKFFISELCERCDNCPQGDLCQKSHNRVEQLYRPEKYKTKFCSFYPNNLDKCDYGIYCSFAHSESDIVVDLIHNYEYDKDFFMFLFKTTWCPFNLIVHDRALCVYAHNYQDFRRKPNVCFYDPNPCPNWKTSEFICNYEDACPNHYNCDKSHGWKESEYHPLHYKTRPCPNLNKCSKNLDCPFFHSSQDQRIIGQQIHYKIFKYHPKNRIVTNIFKITNPINVPKINNEVLNNPERTSSMTNINYDIENKEFSNFYKNQANLYKFNSQNNINFEMKDEINKAFHSYSFPKIDMSQIDNPAYYNQMMAYNNQMKQNQLNQNQNNNNNNNNNMNFNNNQKIDNNNNYKLFNSPQIFQNQNLNNNIQSNSQPNFVTSTSKFTIPDQKSATHFTNYKNSPKKTSKPENSVIGQGSTSHNSHGSIEKKEEREKISLKKKNLLDPEADNSGNSLDMMSNEVLRKMVMTDNFEDNINMKDKQNGRKESSEDIKSDDRLENLLKEICEDDNK